MGKWKRNNTLTKKLRHKLKQTRPVVERCGYFGAFTSKHSLEHSLCPGVEGLRILVLSLPNTAVGSKYSENCQHKMMFRLNALLPQQLKSSKFSHGSHLCYQQPCHVAEYSRRVWMLGTQDLLSLWPTTAPTVTRPQRAHPV